MIQLQKAWIRSAAALVLAFGIGIQTGIFSWPLNKGQLSVPWRSEGADAFCASFAKTILDNHGALILEVDQNEVAALAEGFETRRKVLKIDPRNERVREASLSGRFTTLGLIGAFARDDNRAEAKNQITEAFESCKARLLKQGIPRPPAPPKEGSPEWWTQNR